MCRLAALLLAISIVQIASASAASAQGAGPDSGALDVPARRAFEVRPPAEPIDAVSHVSDLAVGPDGTLYVVDTEGCRVIRVAPDGETLGAWGGCGRAEGRFILPRAVAVAPDGRVAVSDPALGRIQIFDAVGVWLQTLDARHVHCRLAPNECLARRFDDLMGIAYDADGVLHVLDWLQEYRSATSDLLSMRTYAKIAPDGTVLDTEHVSWVPKHFRNGTLVVDGQGRLLAISGRLWWIVPHEEVRGLPFGGFGFGDLSVGSTGQPWALVYDELARLDAQGFIEQAWPLPTGQFSAVAAAPDGSVYIAADLRLASLEARLGEPGESERAAIWRLAPDEQGDGLQPFWGRPAFGGHAAMPGLLRDMAVGGGRVHLLYTTGTTRDGIEIAPRSPIQVPAHVTTLDEAGAFVSRWGGVGLEPGVFAWRPLVGDTRVEALGPMSLTVGPEGDVHVADTEAHRVQRFDRNGAFLGLSADPEASPLRLPVSVSVDASGTLHVLDARHAMHRFDADGEYRDQPLALRPAPRYGTWPWHRMVVSADGRSVDHALKGARGRADIVRNAIPGGEEIARRALLKPEDDPRAWETRLSHGIAHDRHGEPVVIEHDHLYAATTAEGWATRIPLRPIQKRGDKPIYKLGLDEQGDAWVATLSSLGSSIHWDVAKRGFLERYTHAWPTTWRAELFGDAQLAGPAQGITMTEGLSLPDPVAAPAEAVRFERVLGAQELEGGGTVRLHLGVAGGARLWLGDALVVDDWQADSVDITLERFLPATWGERVVLEARTAPVEGNVALEIQLLTPAKRIYLPVADNRGRIADIPWRPTPTPPPGYPGP